MGIERTLMPYLLDIQNYTGGIDAFNAKKGTDFQGKIAGGGVIWRLSE
jgi:hypothetical protein